MEQGDCNPIVICGAARSGTTFVQNLLNAHNDIAISDEYFIYKTPSVITWFQEMTEALDTLYGRGDWATRKALIMRMLWFYTSPEALLQKNMSVRRFGNKTPGAENYLEFYDEVFEKNPPLYVYILREGKEVFRSVRNMPWGKDAHIRGQVKRYCDSIRTIERYQKSNPDRVHIFQVDKIAPHYEARAERVGDLLAFIGEEMNDEIDSFVRKWQPVLTTEGLQSQRKDFPVPLKSLPAADEKFLSEHQEYQHLMEKYGYAQTLLK